MRERLDWNVVNARLAAVERSVENALHPAREHIEQVYRERAARLSLVALNGNARESEPVMIFLVGEERYAIALAHLSEVIRLQSVTPIPGTPKHIAGLINVRGNVRPLFNLKALLQTEAAKNVKATYGLLVNKGKHGLALQADDVQGVGQFFREDAESLHGSPYVTFRTATVGMLLSADELIKAMGETS